jgi:hypothetical protein
VLFDQFPGYDMKILLSDFSAKVGREELTDENKETRMGSSLMLLQHYEEHGEAFLSRIVLMYCALYSHFFSSI